MGHVIVLDRGHVGRTGGRPSARHQHLVEDRLTREYMAYAEDMLTDAGHEVIIVSDSEYKNRQLRANSYGAEVYIACHVNAGGYDIGSVFHDYRSTRGAALAEHIRKPLADIPIIASTGSAITISANPNDWTKNAFYVISRCYDLKPTAVCFEPGFIDTPAHFGLWTPQGLRAIGHALARGILSYFGE